MRRHRTLVSGAAVLLISVLAAAAVGLVLLDRKNREIADQRNAAVTAAHEAEAVNAFLSEDVLGQADPDTNARDKKVTVEELLHKAAGKIDKAEPHLISAETNLRLARTLPRRQYSQCVEQPVKLYEAWGQPEDAPRWRKELARSAESPRATPPGGVEISGPGR
jgi:hypothetical protein